MLQGEKKTLEAKGKDYCGCQCHYVKEQKEENMNILNNFKQSGCKGITTSRGDTSKFVVVTSNVFL